ncbi:unnamed protein product [Brassica napus]|uniref:Uncharacterized protein n=2 Tax=Brassica TaxID=3705 RepID=A0A3P6GT88_BRAOL|nr:unnamed protein product [Brassica napus]VDD56849.1 unnamed protein product [Brassica oleracea]
MMIKNHCFLNSRLEMKPTHQITNLKPGEEHEDPERRYVE